jgi:isoleucyl-tRNA synthetase
MSKELSRGYSKEAEEAVRLMWEKKKIQKKAREQNKGKKKTFYFADGPPYATGHIHMGTALNKILKDVAMRSKRMQGHDVFDRPMYDTHGLPTENMVEKKHGLNSKQEIEKFGVKKFVQECKRFATEFIGVMNGEFDNLGVWMDWNNYALTLSNDSMETGWHTFKNAEKKGLVYQGTYPIHACPRCATGVSYHEIEYQKQTDTSVYVKFKVKEKENTHLIIWTTTPWSLPSNTGVMVHPKLEYAEVNMSNGERWIVAKERVEQMMDAIEAGYTVGKTVLGKELDGWEYENPLANQLDLPELKNAYRVILNQRYVHVEEGSGLVHTAPGCGKEDYEAGIQAGLPTISMVGLDGKLDKTAGKYAGKKARVVDKEIIADLEQSGSLVYHHPFTHDYPSCSRCKTPLLMISTPQWFLKVTQFRKKLIQQNEKVYWTPPQTKGRMNGWLEQFGDWPVSRARYWGTPLPIWVCEACSTRHVIGSIAELEKKSGKKVKELHKPDIDSINIPCKCSGSMKRVPEVLDVWYDAGLSCLAGLSYPQRKDWFKRFWPADFNLEGSDQYRGWWNAQVLTSYINFEETPYKAVSVHGIVLDLGRNKMSKSKGNIVKPEEVIEKHNRDYLRHYLIQNSKGDDFAFKWDNFKDVHRFYTILWNTFNYAQLYAHLSPEKHEQIDAKKLQAEDKWIVSRLHSVLHECTDAYDKYTPHKVIIAIEEFVMNDLSRTYIKLVRDRMGTKTEQGVNDTLNHVLFSLLKVMSPTAPHLTEALYQELKTRKMLESIHLYSLPSGDTKIVDKKLETQMEKGMEIVQTALALREQEKLRLRWPLESIVVKTKTGKDFGKVKKVLAKMANVKVFQEETRKPKGSFAEKELEEMTVYLNTAASPTLKDEWELMELRRKIQDMRKQSRLQPGQNVKLLLSSDDPAFVKKNTKEIEESTSTTIVEKDGTKEKLLQRSFFLKLET